jgi:hypothetical protein
MKFELEMAWLWELEEKPRNPVDDFDDEAASCVSLCHLRTTSRAMGRRW